MHCPGQVCFPRSLLNGMNNIEPLIEFGKENGIPDEAQLRLASLWLTGCAGCRGIHCTGQADHFGGGASNHITVQDVRGATLGPA